jgi:hypothetical protein
MKPHEFWDCTYREARVFVESMSSQKQDEMKEQIILLEALGNKIVAAGFSKKPKQVNLIADTFKKLFEGEFEGSTKHQSIEEQIKNMRSHM